MKNLIKKILKESDFDWVGTVNPETTWDMEKYYVLDITDLNGLDLQETIDDIWDFAYNIGYNVEVDFFSTDYDFSSTNYGYIYFEPDSNVPEGYSIDVAHKPTDPTFNGRYQMLSLKEFYHMAYGYEPNIDI